MAKYKDPLTNEIIEVGMPELNPDLIAGKIQVPDSTPFGTINSSTLTQPTPTDFKTTSGSPAPDVSKLDTSVPELKLTPEEKKADDLSTQLQDIQNRLLGQSAFRVEKEKEADIEGLRKTQIDLSARLKAIQNEAQAIPLQLQTEATGRGITVGGLAPIQIARLRANAIQALSTSSLLEASKGNLTTALDMVDRAVAAKYDPIKEARDVSLANLDLILKSPSYTLAEKNRAEAQKAKIEAQKAVDDKKEEEAKEIGKIAVEAAQKGVDALTLKKIQEAKTSQEALSLAAPFLAEKDKLTAQEKPIIKDYEVDGRLVREVIDPMTGKTISRTNLGGKEKIGTGTIETSDNLKAYAQIMADTGKIPNPTELKTAGLTAGQVAEAAKILPKPKGALVSINTGIKPSTLSATQEEGLTTLNEIVQQTIPELQRIFPTLTTGIIGGIAGKLPLFGGSQARQDYNTLRQEFLSKLLKARSGAAVTEQEYARYSKLLPTTFNQPFFFGTTGEKKLESMQKAMKTSLDNALNTNQLSIYGYSKINLGGQEYTVGQEVELNGVKGRILPDGSIATQ